MKVCYRTLVILGLVATCTALDESLPRSADSLSQLRGPLPPTPDAGTSTVQDPSQNINLASKLELTRPHTLRSRVEMSNSSPSTPTAGVSWGEGSRRRARKESHSGPELLIPTETHMRIPPNKRRKEDELPEKMSDDVDHRPHHPPETLDLLKGFGKDPIPKAPSNLDEMLRDAVLSTTPTLSHRQKSDNAASLDNILSQAVRSHRATQDNVISSPLPIALQDKRSHLSIGLSITPPTQEFHFKTLDNHILAPVVQNKDPRPESSTKLDEILRNALFSHDRTRLSGKNPVQVEQASPHPPHVMTSQIIGDLVSQPVPRNSLFSGERTRPINEDPVQVEKGSSSTHPQNTKSPQIIGDLLSQPVTPSQSIPHAKIIPTNTGITSSNVNPLVLQNPRGNGERSMRLEFTHEVLEGPHPLLEDPLLIELIKKLNKKEIETKIMIDGSNFKEAFRVIKECDYLMKKYTPIDLAIRFPILESKNYIDQCGENGNQPTSRKPEKRSFTNEHNSELLKSAIQIFRMNNQNKDEVTHTFDQGLETEVTPSQSIPHAKIIPTNTGITSSNVNPLVLQNPRGNGERSMRLEFTHEVLEGPHPLLEDPLLIELIKKLNKKEIETKIMIDGSNFKEAFRVIKECDYLMKKYTPIDLAIRFPVSKPRRYYIFVQSSKMWENRWAWYRFWNQRITSINVEKMETNQQAGNLKRVFLLFLFYVEMIDSIFPHNNVEGSFTNEHNSELLKSAIQIFRMNNQNKDEVTHTFDQGLETEGEVKKLNGYGVQITGKKISGNLRDTVNPMLWKSLAIWINGTG
ncbi:hypothetical protein H4Q26_015614 [Puccinia striiformis f. sp. tritici PST-130]|nr:hypothetical protein H4Q26_015614 [Puccinia striiformis f. sp. tritici PST-130]